jgi:hypothetical protein
MTLRGGQQVYLSSEEIFVLLGNILVRTLFSAMDPGLRGANVPILSEKIIPSKKIIF